MITTMRAALAASMLLGFYVLAFAIVGGLGYLTYLAFSNDVGGGSAKLGYLTVVVAGSILYALWKVIRSKPEPPSAPLVTPEQAPELWHTVRELAGAAGTRAPDEIRLIPEVNAAVSEDSRLLGLVAGRRRMYLGVPLLQAFTVAQLRSVLAHELGHYSNNHTRLGAIAYRGQQAIVATVQQVGGLAGFVLRQYAKIYILVNAAVGRRQELEADRLSVLVAGRATAQGALRELPVLDAAWNFYGERYIAPGWQHKLAPMPGDFFRGFGEMLRARTDELAKLRSEAPQSQQSKWDTHPSIAARIAAMDAMADTAVPVDSRPAGALIPMFENACEAVAASSLDYGTRQQLPWDEFSGRSVQAEEQRLADLVYRAAGRLTGNADAGLSTVLDLVAAGRLPELAREVTDGEAKSFVEPMTLLLRVAAVRSGTGTWRHSWTGAPDVIGRDAQPQPQPLPLAAIAALAVDPRTVDQARAELAALGIDLATAVVVDKVATAHGGDVIGGLANVEFNGAPHDLVILDNGLILTPCPKKTEGGKHRLIMFLQSAPPVELAQRNIFLPSEEMAAAVLVKSTPVRVDITMRDGRVMKVHETWSGERLTKESDDALKALVQPILQEPAKR